MSELSAKEIEDKRGLMQEAYGWQHKQWINALCDMALRSLESAVSATGTPKFDDIEQYRLQMAGISTAAIGYWHEGMSIHADYDTIALRDVAKLYAKYEAKHKRVEELEAMLAAAPVAATGAQEAVESIHVSDILREADHIEQNGIAVAKFGGEEVHEGRCRVLCAMYLREFVTIKHMSDRLNKLYPEKPVASAPEHMSLLTDCIAGLEREADGGWSPAASEHLRKARRALGWIADACAVPEERAMWQPIATAPKNGSLLLLLIGLDDERCCELEDTDRPSRTVGHNNFDHDGEDKWHFAGWNWENDYYTEGHGTPTHWRPYMNRVPHGD